MNTRHTRFAEAIIAGRSGVDAAVVAGYSAKSAKVTASKLRRDPRVRAEIERLQANRPVPRHRQAGADLTPLEFLLSVMRDPSESIVRRLAAAKAALPYLSVAPSGKKAQRAAAAQEVGSGRFPVPKEPPGLRLVRSAPPGPA